MDFARVRAVQVKVRRCVREGWAGERKDIVDEEDERQLSGGIVSIVPGVHTNCWKVGLGWPIRGVLRGVAVAVASIQRIFLRLESLS